MASTPKLPIDLIPTPGFCIKSTVVNPATLQPPTKQDAENLLEPVGPLVVPAGRKVFINICYDKNVPPPPSADEQTIKRAMTLEGQDKESTYYVPVVVSHPREEKDKAGNPSLVFDCVYNSTVKSRALRDSDFKIFLVELALQRIEAQTALTLSRQIGTPNISAKGKLEPRRVWVPAWLATGQYAPGKDTNKTRAEKPLIQEIGASGNTVREGDAGAGQALPKLKGILKHGGANKALGGGTNVADGTLTPTPQSATRTSVRPTWTWKKSDGDRLTITVDVSKKIPHDIIKNATLDVEPRRLLLTIPGSAFSSPLELDINLNKSDAEIVASMPGVSAAGVHGASDNEQMKEPNTTLLLKRQRDFDVDAASAEWRVAEGSLVIHV
ncbi:hypothetical protein NP233_g6825 [Leucocoprinus birnbaumii]|uniref:PIH1 N-terminal domain-containing protein n=1 Tax=Leucocoprinus birnbaumii TaxID=56174 RepID=A0AAD5VQG4_9AGAR|nr:hypothetical protein NP233_g6825 [Leucocoprinus birnbaumii]